MQLRNKVISAIGFLFVVSHNFTDGFSFAENISDSPCEAPSTNKISSRKTHLEDSPLSGIKKAVVVLTRLPDYKISALRPPTPQQFYSEDESLSSSDTDMQWEPEDDSSDSDFSVSNNKQKTVKPTGSDTTKPQSSSRNNNSGNATNNTMTCT